MGNCFNESLFSFFFIAEILSLIKKKNDGLVLPHLVVNVSSCMPASSCIVCLCNCSVQPNAVRTQIRKHEQIRLKSKEKENSSRHTLVCSH